MSTWVVQVVVVGLFALTCGALAAAWMRGRLGVAAVALFVVALVAWVVAFAAIAGRSAMRTASRPATRTARRCTTSPRRAFLAPPLLIALLALAMPRRAATGGGSGERGRMAAVASSFKLPDLGEGLTEGEVARWLVAEGQEIAEDDPLVEIQTDKATVEIPLAVRRHRAQDPRSRGRDRTRRHRARAHRRARRGNAEQGPLEASAASAQARVRKQQSVARNGWRAASERVQATPVVRRIAQELGVDLAGVTGSGPGGRIVEDDVRSAAAGVDGRRELLRGVRRVIAEHMARAHARCRP